MHSENYKKRAGDVRRAARADLLEIRKARMARKSAISRDGGQRAPTPETVTPTAAAVSVGDDVPGLAETTPLLGSDTELGDATVDINSADPLDELAIKNAALAEITAPEAPVLPEIPAVEEQAVPVTDQSSVDAEQNSGLTQVTIRAEAGADYPSPEDHATAPDATDTWLQSDLAQLPGAGPGLVWMLEECEVHNLAQLAASDPAALSTKLGVVGQILDVGQWVQFAQDQAPRPA